jgi:hypothetical protein
VGTHFTTEFSLRDFKTIPYSNFLMTAETLGLTNFDGRRRVIDWTKEDTQTYVISTATSTGITADSLAFSCDDRGYYVTGGRDSGNLVKIQSF